MKKFFMSCSMMAALLFSAGYLTTSCSDAEDVKTEKPDGGDPEEGGQPGDTSVPTPIRWEENETAKPDNGVQIKVTTLTTDNIRFECIPGKYSKSYRIDVYPLARLYDIMYSMNMEDINGGKKLTTDETEAIIRELIFNQEGSGGFGFNSSEESLGDEYFTGYEFDWAADYKQFQIMPNCEYLIVAVGCGDENAEDGRDMTICHVTTPEPEGGLIGLPEVNIGDIDCGYSAFGVNLTPGADAKYYITMPVLSKYVEYYYDLFGEDLFREMVRYASEPGEITETANMYPTYGIWADPKEPITVFTLAFDENYMAGDLISKEFYMPLAPEDAVPADVTLTLDESKLGATIANFKIHMDENAALMKYRLLMKSEWDGYKDDPAQLEKLKTEMKESAWTEKNSNFKAELDENGVPRPTGEGIDLESIQFGLTDDAEHVVAYFARNTYEQYSELKTITFKTKEYKKYAGQVDPAVKYVTESGKTNIKFTFDVDGKITPMYYYALVVDSIGSSVKNMNNKELVDLLFNSKTITTYACPIVPEYDPEYIYTGLNPAKTYYFLLASEDWNGNLSKVQILEATTEKVVAGPNPEVTLKGKSEFDPLFGATNFIVNFDIVRDVASMRYGIFPDDKMELTTYEAAKKYWTEFVTDPEAGGMESVNSSELVYTVPGFGDIPERAVAVAVGYGLDDARSNTEMIYYLIKEDKVVTDLREIFADAPAPKNVVGTRGITTNLLRVTERVAAEHNATLEYFINELKALNESSSLANRQYEKRDKAPAPVMMSREEFLNSGL